MQILKDIHLDSLQCSRCGKYLSVFPVKNHLTREISCGRCSSLDDEGVRSTLYELIAEKYLFRCVNRYEGCRRLLRVEETEAHEEVCKGKVYECPKCRDGTDLSILELIWHYKLRHSASYLKKCCFEGKMPVNDVMLYVQNQVVFFIFFEYDSSLNILYFAAATLTDVNVRQQFLISQGSFCKLTEKKSCKLVNSLDRGDFNVTLNSVESIEVIFLLEVLKNVSMLTMPSTGKEKKCRMNRLGNCLFTAQLKAELKKNLTEYKWTDNGTALVNGVGQQIDVACTNCKLIIGLPVFRCELLQHQLCYSCRSLCSICDCSVKKSLSNDILLEISSYLNLSCKWKCGKFFSTSDIRNHEKVCELRSKKCPFCPLEVDLKLMKSHLLDKHEKYFLEEYEVKEVIKLICNIKKGIIYFLLNDHWCYLEWNQVNNQQYTVQFELHEKVPNATLCVILSAFKFEIGNSCIPFNLPDIALVEPYLKFTHK